MSKNNRSQQSYIVTHPRVGLISSETFCILHCFQLSLKLKLCSECSSWKTFHSKQRSSSSTSDVQHHKFGENEVLCIRTHIRAYFKQMEATTTFGQHSHGKCCKKHTKHHSRDVRKLHYKMRSSSTKNSRRVSHLQPSSSPSTHSCSPTEFVMV
jgi:hypothetical protein